MSQIYITKRMRFELAFEIFLIKKGIASDIIPLMLVMSRPKNTLFLASNVKTKMIQRINEYVSENEKEAVEFCDIISKTMNALYEVDVPF